MTDRRAIEGHFDGNNSDGNTDKGNNKADNEGPSSDEKQNLLAARVEQCDAEDNRLAKSYGEFRKGVVPNRGRSRSRSRARSPSRSLWISRSVARENDEQRAMALETRARLEADDEADDEAGKSGGRDTNNGINKDCAKTETAIELPPYEDTLTQCADSQCDTQDDPYLF